MNSLKRYLKYVLFFAIVFSFGVSCNSDDDGNQGNCGNAVCTEEFRAFDVSVVNRSQEPIALDEFVVTWVESGRNLTLDYSQEDLEVYQASGMYPLISDSYLSDFRSRVISLTFEGYINGELVVDEDFTVAFDCCHVFLIEGDLEVVLGVD
ncbi:hypothetical protein [Robertkochia flava]|uniref:hypothetical protein n=1 Tax=Robertkochia flava TaxID=3447986 RepID=UPI001CCBCC91|nr:hypothetical protein [Robertkochia marina]